MRIFALAILITLVTGCAALQKAPNGQVTVGKDTNNVITIIITPK